MSYQKMLWICWLSILFVLIGLGAYFADANEMLVENSIAYQEEKPLMQLFSELGLIAPITEKGITNPCYDLKDLTLKWCTPHSITKLIKEDFFVDGDKHFFDSIIGSKNVCQLTSEYVGRTCSLENFKKIIKHYSLKN